MKEKKLILLVLLVIVIIIIGGFFYKGKLQIVPPVEEFSPQDRFLFQLSPAVPIESLQSRPATPLEFLETEPAHGVIPPGRSVE